MKTIKIVTLFAALLFLHLSSTAQNNKMLKLKTPERHSNWSLQKNKFGGNPQLPFNILNYTFSKPGTSEDYVWEQEEIGQWVHYSNTFYTYDENGVLLVELSLDAQTGEYLSLYNYEYDEKGKLAEETSSYWNGFDWTIFDGYKYEFYYDENGNLTDEIDLVYENNAWVNDSKSTYIYENSDVPTQMISFSWNGTTWVAESRYIDLSWFNWQKEQVASYVMQSRVEGNMWVNNKRFTGTYDGNNSTSIYENWNGQDWVMSEKYIYSKTTSDETYTSQTWVNGEWENFEKYTTLLDEYGNSTAYQYHYWNNGEWTLEYAYSFGLTYNENSELTDMIIQYWEPGMEDYMNVSKYIYSDFLYFTTGIPDVRELGNVYVYPNPVKNSVTVQIEEDGIQSFYLDIIDLCGKTLYTHIYSGSSALVNLERLKTGIYVIRLRTNAGKAYSQKLIKE